MQSDTKKVDRGPAIYVTLGVREDDTILNKYKEIAHHIKDTKEIKEIERIMDVVVSSKALTVPFIFLGGSSGMGKTQTALTIREKLRFERIVLYFLGTQSDETQWIYKPFDHFTAMDS
jgi:predicted ATP-dependent serine protease